MRQTLTSMQWVIWSTKAALHSQLIIVYKTHTHIRIISSSTFEQCNWKPIQVYCFKHLLQHRQQHNTHRAVQLSHLHSKPYRISQKANFPYCHQSHSNTDNVNELFVIGNAGFMWMREQLNTSGNDKLVSQLCVCDSQSSFGFAINSNHFDLLTFGAYAPNTFNVPLSSCRKTNMFVWRLW